jgi:hypothetical protein
VLKDTTPTKGMHNLINDDGQGRWGKDIESRRAECLMLTFGLRSSMVVCLQSYCNHFRESFFKFYQ